MTCAHIEAAEKVDTPEVDGCPECVAMGFSDWVHLRQCLTCGHVACCDSSPRRHATQHFLTTHHPVMQSIEPGEFWRWCYLDETIG